MNISGILDGQQVTIVSQQGSKDQIYTSYLTSAGLLKVTRKAIGIDDVENIASGAVSQDNINTFSSLSQQISGTNNRTLLVGSSTTEQCCNIFIKTFESSAQLNETIYGYWFQLQKRFRSPFTLSQNIASGGTVYDWQRNSLYSQTSAWDSYDIVFLQYMANDLEENTIISAYTSAIEQDIKYLLQKGKKIVLITPHAKNVAMSETTYRNRYLKYREYADWCYTREKLYDGKVFVADHHKVLNYDYNRGYEYYKDEQHLNYIGSAKAATAWDNIVKRLGFEMPEFFSGYSLGTVSQELYTSGAGISQTAIQGVDLGLDSLGRSQFLCSGSTGLATLYRSKTVSAGVYRIVADFYHISDFPGENNWGCGAKIAWGDTHRRLGIAYQGSAGIGDYLMISHPIKFDTPTSINLHFYPGGVSILRGIYLIKVQ